MADNFFYICKFCGGSNDTKILKKIEITVSSLLFKTTVNHDPTTLGFAIISKFQQRLTFFILLNFAGARVDLIKNN